MPGEQPVVPKADVRTYYDRPVLKPPTWKHWIPSYLFLGGLAGASSTLAMAADLAGSTEAVAPARVVALGAISLGAGALVADLGRPERFYNMLRVAKPTSPMSVGTWLLAAYAPAAGVAAGSSVLGRLPGVGRVAGVAAGLVGTAVATYTGVLVADTAIPAWHGVHRELPWFFAASAAASAGGAAVVTASVGGRSGGGATYPRQNPGWRWAVGGAVAELAVKELSVRRLDPRVARAWHEGDAGRLGRLAKASLLGGAALVVAGRRRRAVAALGGLLVATGSALERFSVAAAGTASALDVEATVGPQRDRAGAARATMPG